MSVTASELVTGGLMHPGMVHEGREKKISAKTPRSFPFPFSPISFPNKREKSAASPAQLLALCKPHVVHNYKRNTCEDKRNKFCRFSLYKTKLSCDGFLRQPFVLRQSLLMKQELLDISIGIFWYLIADDFCQHFWELNTHGFIQKCLEAKAQKIFNHLRVTRQRVTCT